VTLRGAAELCHHLLCTLRSILVTVIIRDPVHPPSLPTHLGHPVISPNCREGHDGGTKLGSLHW
jgi:hypothetical protein